MTGARPPRTGGRTAGRTAFAVVFALLALNAWLQVILVPLGQSSDPAALTGLQLVVGAAAASAAWGSWTGARWAPAAALGYGVVAAAMVVLLGPLLALAADERRGLLTGAAVIALFAAWAAWYLRRAIARERPAATRPSA